MSQQEDFTREWTTLQNNFEAYERGGLAIKALAVIAYLWIPADAYTAAPLAIAFTVLWIIEAIYRTYQSRLGERLLRVEAALRNVAPETQACQLHSEFLAGRGGAAALLTEYLKSALRPGIAFPYPIFIISAFWY